MNHLEQIKALLEVAHHLAKSVGELYVADEILHPLVAVDQEMEMQRQPEEPS